MRFWNFRHPSRRLSAEGAQNVMGRVPAICELPFGVSRLSFFLPVHCSEKLPFNSIFAEELPTRIPKFPGSAFQPGKLTS